MLKMLEYMRITILDCLISEYSISYSVSNEIVSIYFETARVDNKQDKIYAFSRQDSEVFLEKIQNIGIYSWQEVYTPQENILDGQHWTLAYKEFGKPQQTFRGSNAYPDNWQDFLTVTEHFKQIASDVLFSLY